MPKPAESELFAAELGAIGIASLFESRTMRLRAELEAARQLNLALAERVAELLARRAEKP